MASGRVWSDERENVRFPSENRVAGKVSAVKIVAVMVLALISDARICFNEFYLSGRALKPA